MAVKFLTTKKHVKTAKVINKIKEDNKPIEFVKADPKNMVDKPIGKTIAKIKEPKIIVDKPITKIPKIGKREYNRALKIVNQYLKENEKN
jgi:hypothetical protein